MRFFQVFAPPLSSRQSLTELRSPDPFLSHPQTKADAGISAFPGESLLRWTGTIEGPDESARRGGGGQPRTVAAPTRAHKMSLMMVPRYGGTGFGGSP